jgi:hypothetical protein
MRAEFRAKTTIYFINWNCVYIHVRTCVLNNYSLNFTLDQTNINDCQYNNYRLGFKRLTQFILVNIKMVVLLNLLLNFTILRQIRYNLYRIYTV